MSAPRDDRRELPAVGALLTEPRLAELCERFGRPRVKEAVRARLEALRRRAGEKAHADAVEGELARLPELLAADLAGSDLSLRPVINATGVVLHTNLGRAPLSARAIAAVVERAGGYTNVEMDLASGARGRRASGALDKLRALTGAEAALVVNNNAAAVMLVLDSLARGREVVVSRGELVEIGGAFRIPDVCAKSGARLVEVGTTNRTRRADYASAITPETAALLKVHPSNFRIVGFTEEVGLAELASLARERGVTSLFDLGSGAIRLPVSPGGRPVLHGETTARQALDAGLDVVTFSGDKLLGGPQSGIVLGRAPLLERIRKNALYRALRVDKVTLLLLEATLESYVRERELEEIPALRMLSMDAGAVAARAQALLEALGDDAPRLGARLRATTAASGAGSAPLDPIPSAGIAIAPRGVGAEALLAWLRAAARPIVARVEDDEVVLDLRTVTPEEEPLLLAALRRALPGA